ncbi:TolC family protein [Flavobacterium aurantiibacter]|uniref:Transporter n=1 Tax=Flavobacterium aurantiibacter TaxID=2023067 RepID=A0A255ZMB6_9FLAO|nr:TolC family protein [Flavobacterium aurantiibacter]OYQ42648.1 transporter [Flavobacterium aurantiibacter]
MKCVFKIYLVFCFGLLGYSQNKLLEDYIKIGLENNEVVKQHNFNINKSIWALKEANSLFYPTTSFNANYTVAAGGRTIDIPIGDLLNPVYNTLNQLTNSSVFPRLENQSVLINPNNFYDAKIHTTVPLLNYEIIYNKRIKRYQNQLRQVEVDIYKRELVKDIKIAYFKYMQSKEAITIYETALKLAKENQRVNQSLFTNQKINRTAVLRSDNEVKRIEARLVEANQNSKNAQAYFNFLINQKLDTGIEIDISLSAIPTDFNSENTQKREEFTQLQKAAEINTSVSKLTQSAWFPKLSGFIDIGYQDFDFEVTKQSRYYFGGIALEWNIFSGNKNKYKLKQIEEEAKSINSQTENVKQQLLLQYEISKNNLLSKLEIYKSEKSQNIAAKKYNDDVSRLYKEGQALYIELLDAQNQYINALLNSNIALYETWIAYAELERANATYTFNF